MSEVERFQTMSLGTPGTCTIPNHRATFQQSLKLGPEAGRATNRTNDIDGAEPSKYATLTNRAHFHDPADVRGAKPLVLHRSVNAPDNKLRVDDIDGFVFTYPFSLFPLL